MQPEIVLISLYDMGRQPFGLASPAAWLRRSGATVRCLDLSVCKLDEAAIAQARLVAFFLPMHTATRMAAGMLQRIRELNSAAHLCCYGLYAPLNESYLRELGVDSIIGGEFEEALVALWQSLHSGADESTPLTHIDLPKLRFIKPDRADLPDLAQYATLDRGDGSTSLVGYTETSRGCKHRCRHCPIVPVYDGAFRIVQRDVVLADIAQQVEMGATHITFGDPDFFNGPGHAVAIVRELHRAFPHLTYDVTIKIEHLLQHRRYLDDLRETGCLFITSAVESVDDDVLAKLEKGHTVADFIEAVALLRNVGIHLNPTFVAFHPWLTVHDYIEFLRLIAELELVDCVSPIQYAIRLLIPAGSRLLELEEVRHLVGDFDRGALVFPWTHPIPEIDRLQQTVIEIVGQGEISGATRRELFDKIWYEAQLHLSSVSTQWLTMPLNLQPLEFVRVPALSEHWYC